MPTPAFLRRQIPVYELLGEEGPALIETNADRILADVGVEIRGDEVALGLFNDAGATVERRWITSIRARAGAVRHRPSQFTQLARNPARSVEIGGDAIVFAPAYGSPFVRDLRNGRRYASLEDFEAFVKLAYLTPWLHHSGGTVCEPVDVPVNKRHLDMVYAHLRYSDKAMMGSVTQPSRAEDSIEMARIAFGADVVERSCVILGNVNVNSPPRVGRGDDGARCGPTRPPTRRRSSCPSSSAGPWVRSPGRRRRAGPRRDDGRCRGWVS
jgi:trimethylamine--corrinoid protein Co-methyltransferase